MAAMAGSSYFGGGWYLGPHCFALRIRVYSGPYMEKLLRVQTLAVEGPRIELQYSAIHVVQSI